VLERGTQTQDKVRGGNEKNSDRDEDPGRQRGRERGRRQFFHARKFGKEKKGLNH